MAPRPLRKIFLSCKTEKRLEEDLYLKGEEKEFTIAKFSKVNALKKKKKKGRSQVYHQEELYCLKLR